MHVTVTVQVYGREVPIEQVADAKVVAALKDLGKQVQDKLEGLSCTTHEKPPGNVRVHVDANGNADIRYDSCCDALKSRVTTALG
jgi:hypothetical protein